MHNSFLRKRKLFRKKTAIIYVCILVGMLSLVATYYHARFIATVEYQMHTQTYTYKTLPKTFDNFKIGFLSDIHLQDIDDISRLQQIVTTMNAQACDIIIFGGDLYDSEIFDSSEVIAILKQLTSTSGKFAVQGEKDQAHGNEVSTILNEAGFEVLHNEYRKIHYNNDAFALFGLENTGDLSGLLHSDNQDMYKLVIVHEPDYFQTTAKHNIDLQVSGHSLGGYIQLPFYGSVVKKTNAQLYTNGTYEIENARLVISNGLGVESSQNFRFFCPNEIVIVSLTGTKEMPSIEEADIDAIEE